MQDTKRFSLQYSLPFLYRQEQDQRWIWENDCASCRGDTSTCTLVTSCCKPWRWIGQDRPEELDASQNSWFPSACRQAPGLHITSQLQLTATLLLIAAYASDSIYCSSQTELDFVCACTVSVCVCVELHVIPWGTLSGNTYISLVRSFRFHAKRIDRLSAAWR